ncbi:MAG TPA: S41 family peptidase [Pyrinomonadaceae bacterium]|nr:S41 family peptidase [Pyrinomonadaceae bacterium]
MNSSHPRTRFAPLQLPFAIFLCLVFSGASPAARAQTADFNRKNGVAILNTIKREIQKNYYDPTFRGVDLDKFFEPIEAKIMQASSIGEVLGIIAQGLMRFEDSHTFLIPPMSATQVEHGWKMQMYGDDCFVVAVKPGSDAEAQGLRPGDRVLSVNGMQPTRRNIWKLYYHYYVLMAAKRLQLSVETPEGKQREVTVAAKVTERKRILDLTGAGDGTDINYVIREAETEAYMGRHRYIEVGDDAAVIWRMTAFDLTDADIDKLVGKARKRKALVLDLRGNSGGNVSTLKRLVGNLFDRDVKVADMKGRKELKPMTAKSRGDQVFKGQLVVLVDSESGSAAEVLARVVQLEKRGTVIGDRTAGAVMQSRAYQYKSGLGMGFVYGVSITDADLIMADGKSLEHTGVTPDELVLPTAKDLAAGRDPVLTRAGALVGLRIDPEKAGALFPYEWRK